MIEPRHQVTQHARAIGRTQRAPVVMARKDDEIAPDHRLVDPLCRRLRSGPDGCGPWLPGLRPMTVSQAPTSSPAWLVSSPMTITSRSAPGARGRRCAARDRSRHRRCRRAGSLRWPRGRQPGLRHASSPHARPCVGGVVSPALGDLALAMLADVEGDEVALGEGLVGGLVSARRPGPPRACRPRATCGIGIELRRPGCCSRRCRTSARRGCRAGWRRDAPLARKIRVMRSASTRHDRSMTSPR